MFCCSQISRRGTAGELPPQGCPPPHLQRPSDLERLTASARPKTDVRGWKAAPHVQPLCPAPIVRDCETTAPPIERFSSSYRIHPAVPPDYYIIPLLGRDRDAGRWAAFLSQHPTVLVSSGRGSKQAHSTLRVPEHAVSSLYSETSGERHTVSGNSIFPIENLKNHFNIKK